MAVDFMIGAKECSLDTMPPATGAYPFYFATPIPVYIDVSFNYSVMSSINAVATGYILGFNDNNMYPFIRIDRQDGHGGGYGGFWFGLGSAIMSQDYECHVTKYDDNGTKTEDYVTQGGCDATLWWGGNIPNGVVHINHSTIPVILENNWDMEIYAYQTGGDVQHLGAWEALKNYTSINFDYILNAADEVIPDGHDFHIHIGWTNGTWTSDQQPPVSMAYFQGIRGKITSGKMALYRMSGIIDGKLQLGIYSNATFYGLETSSDNINWNEVSENPYTFFYRKHFNELGTFGYALYESTKYIPIYGDFEKAKDWVDDPDPDAPPVDADNWDDISPDYPPDNPTGDPDDETEFGEVSSRNMFSQLYLCNVSALYEISNDLFDYDVTTLTGLWDDIKKGLEMYGSNPMEVVQGLRYYPCDLSQVFQSVQSQNYIYFGAYQLQLQNSSVLKVIYANGYIDLGTIAIKRGYNDWRDFEPYTKVFVYLPYVGYYPLEARKYYGKSVNIRYYIDLRTGACTACLIANGVLLDWFDGVIGTEMPITLTDYSSYAQSQLNIIMRNAGIGIAAEGVGGNVIHKVGKNAITSAGSAAAEMTEGSAAATVIGTGAGVTLGAGALVGGIAVGTAMKTTFDLMRDGTAGHTKTRPASSSMINQYLPQYPFFRFEIMEIDESAYLNELYGRPSNASGIIGNFSGYLEVEDVMLICPIATDVERQEIIDLLKSGIYI